MSSSNSRASSVRVTYLDRAKAKRSQMAVQDEENSSDSTNEGGTHAAPPNTSRKAVPSQPKVPKNSTRSAATPAKARAVATPAKPRKRVEDAEPQPPTSVRSTRQTPKPAPMSDAIKPTPRRGRRGSLESRKTVTRSASKPASTSQRAQTPARRAPSVVSRRSKRLSNAGNKPPSGSGRRSMRGEKAGGQDDEDEDEDEDDEEGGSDMDSDPEAMLLAATGKIRRDVKDRQQYFSNQSDCAAFGPYRVLCSRCNTFVNLSKHQTYAVAPWEKHRAKCDQELASDAQPPPNAEKEVNLPAEEIFVAAPIRRSASERQAFLLADNLAEVIEESRAKCRNCEKWVGLNKKKPYDLHKWQRHRDQCVKETPLRDDPGDGQRRHDIVGESHEHPIEDRGSNSATNLLEQNSVLFPATSAASVEAAPTPHLQALVNSKASQEIGSEGVGEPTRVVKRPREIEVEQASQDGDETERPTNRPRKESTALDWLMLPFRSFVRGFRESLTFDDSDIR